MDEKVIFDEEDFVKIGDGDTIIFDEDFLGKAEEQIIKVVLEWNGGADLDISAIMLNASGKVTNKADLVFYGSERRWKAEDKEQNPFDGEVSLWENCSAQYKNKIEWQDDTLPISLDDSVIGSWDDRGGVPVAINSEILHIQLDKIDIRKYRKIAIIATINLPTTRDVNGRIRMLEGEKFKDIINPVVKIYNATEKRQLLQYNMDNKSPNADAVCCGYMQYNEEKASWEFLAAEVGYCGRKDGDYYKGGILLVANSFV
ncbi:MAG: TerD family protein [Bacteroidaceae bacterium]|nr:TerD family protein [Bacteroidaceae bacterium]